MEELKHELEKLSKAYKDTPEIEEKVLIPFIKKLLELPMKERRKLLPVIRDLQWIKGRFAGFSSETFCSRDRARFLAAVQFVCANKKEMDMAYDINFDLICKLLPLYCPTWLTDFINDDKSWNNFNLSYEELMSLMDMGYLKELAPSRIAHVLPGCIRVATGDPKKKDSFDSNLLLKRDIILKEHIWTIFEYDSSVSYQDDSAKSAYKEGTTPQDESISTALYRFSLDGHIDRNRLLKATLTTFHRGFKKDMAGWFAGFFETLQPTTEELLSLQEEMMQVFTSSYTKPINVMLQQFKKIAAEDGFCYQEFVERATTLFFSSPKNSLFTIYSIFEKITAQHPEMGETCCITLCQLFLKKDESLQKKAAGFITKYGDASSSVLQETLQAYQPEMFQSAQTTIATFNAQSTENAQSINKTNNTETAYIEAVNTETTTTAAAFLSEEPSTETIRICREDNRIPYPANKEDFLFQLSRLFDMEESWETDTTIAAIIAFHPQLDEEDFSRMEPIFQRAANIVASSWMPYEDLLATFLLEYQRLWAQADTTPQGFLRNMFTRLEEKLKGIDSNRGAYDERAFKRLADWKPGYSNATCFIPFKKLWIDVICRIKGGNTLPLLSAPTHTPAYIQATELIQRLAAYQKAGTKPNTWDFQLAIARCAMEDKEEAIATARQLLKDEYLHLFLFLLDEDTQPESPYNHQPAWITAGLVKSPETEFKAFKSFSCSTLPHNYLSGDYGWKKLKPKENSYDTDKHLLQLEFYKWHEYTERNSHQLWQEHLIINSRYNMDDSRYMEPLLCCFPNHPEPLIAQIITCYMSFGTPQEDSKRSIAHALRMLLSFHCPLREMSLLLLGGSLLFADKTVRSYAAELWVEGLTAGRINNHRVGEILARLVCMELAPLKRFTTQVYESMYKRSNFHNRQLEELLTVFICGLPDKPVTGLKQLLELHLELLTNNHSKVTDEQLRQRLQEWTTSSNLKKVITTLNNL
ncbi:DUF6493 family protein [Bacteroides faecium]|uniref:D-tyrosyl-tRNA(Tyr) deacylase n=1 Tax=Bacteroides faecium TaxID=2715212 RepID=A0A6H0KLS3_9BACE|nr:DUF6493 family protein [Bacteroides faecium]QIU93317.1 hypothetical protein BacF7301_03760 [Bacteroides faecium]